MAWGYRASSFATTGSLTYNTGNTKALGAAVSAGDRIVVGVVVHNASALPAAPTVTDNVNAGNYTEDCFKDVLDGTSHARVSLFSHANSGAGTPTVTVATTAGNDGGFCVAAYSGLLASDPGTDVTKTNSGTQPTTATSTATANTTAANELVVGYYGDDGWNNGLGSANVGTGFTFRGDHHSDATSYEGLLEDKDSGTSGTAQTAALASGQPNITGTPWGMLCAVYQLAAAGGGGLPPGLGPNEMMDEPGMTTSFLAAMMR